MTTTTEQQWLTQLQAALVTAGVSTPDADYLASAYPNADPTEFMAGLDWIVELYSTLQVPTAARPTGEPWANIAEQMAQSAPGDIESAFATAIAVESPPLQLALLNALFSRTQYRETQNAQQTMRKRKAKSSDYLKALADLGYAFRMNLLNDTIEVKIGTDWHSISDPLAAKIRKQMRDRGFEYVNVMEDAYIAEAYDNQYHPVRDYLAGLVYDGQSHITNLAAHFTDRDGVFPLFIRRWLIGAVARAYKSEQNRVLVLDGHQNLGKSFFAKWLGSVLPGCFVELPIATDDKDAWVRLASKWIWEVSEFGSTTRKSDRESLKFFLTMNTVTVRKSYGRFDMIKPALANFIGTFNDEGGVLTDPTGNRRFMICKLTGINWDYAQHIDVQQVWAEAYAAYRNGESWHLTSDEVRLAADINERYEVGDPMEGLLKQFFRIKADDSFIWTPTHEIITTLEANGLRGGSTRQNGMALASLMTKLGCERVRKTNQNGQRVWVYQGVEPI